MQTLFWENQRMPLKPSCTTPHCTHRGYANTLVVFQDIVVQKGFPV